MTKFNSDLEDVNYSGGGFKPKTSGWSGWDECYINTYNRWLTARIWKEREGCYVAFLGYYRVGQRSTLAAAKRLVESYVEKHYGKDGES